MILVIYAHCSDRCCMFLRTENGQTLAKIENDYPPNIRGLSGGDAVEFEIDLETGKVLNLPDIETIKRALKIENED